MISVELVILGDGFNRVLVLRKALFTDGKPLGHPLAPVWPGKLRRAIRSPEPMKSSPLPGVGAKQDHLSILRLILLERRFMV